MSSLQQYSASDAQTDILKGLREDGAVIVHEILSSAVLQQLNAELDPLLEAADPAMRHINSQLDAFFGDKVRHISGMAGKSTLFAEEVMCNPLYLSLCDEILLPNCADYVLNLGHVMDRGEGAEQQWLHRDEDAWVHAAKVQSDIQVASVVAMVDFTKDNGATTIVPGSHKWPRDREPLEEEYAYAEMPAGSAVIYLGDTIHGGGTNITSQWRRGLHLSYCLGWLRTEENNVLAVRPEQVQKLSSRAQQLLGYGVHDAIEDAGGYLGMVDMRNPQEVLERL